MLKWFFLIMIRNAKADKSYQNMLQHTVCLGMAQFLTTVCDAIKHWPTLIGGNVMKPFTKAKTPNHLAVLSAFVAFSVTQLLSVT